MAALVEIGAVRARHGAYELGAGPLGAITEALAGDVGRLDTEPDALIEYVLDHPSCGGRLADLTGLLLRPVACFVGGGRPANGARNGMDLRSEAVLAFTRRRRCAFCHRRAPSHAHRYPLKSRLGYVDDSRVAPACRECHDRCHGVCPPGKASIDDAEQQRAVDENQLAFFFWATTDEWRRLGADRARRLEHPPVEF